MVEEYFWSTRFARVAHEFMNWFFALLNSSIGKKLLMALTGLFLITFLIVHLAGNWQLLKDDGGHAFNVYAAFMTSNPLIKTVSYVLYASILLHALWALLLSIGNSRARGSSGYHKVKNSSIWASRNMGILGTVIFVFLVIHMRDFWAVMHWGHLPTKEYDGAVVKDLYSVVALAFGEPWYVILYVICMGVLAFHLWHGFASAFQTLGLNHVKYNRVIKWVGRVYAIVIPALFAWIPIGMFYF